ncbi:MAG: hypothetical protein HQM04_10650 [Magnetococcales bacterium]|nr:hypothetical protein [Magnetococcales bacterium]MBF0115483.1 hypothetical protein [Magnetococcales bacterium]
MKAYGVKRKDCGCCPGHDKFSRDTYNSRRSKKAQTKATKIAHGIARARIKNAIDQTIAGKEDAFFDGV